MSEPKDELTPPEFDAWREAVWAEDEAGHQERLAHGAYLIAQGKRQQALATVERIKSQIIQAYQLLPQDSLDYHTPAIKRGPR